MALHIMIVHEFGVARKITQEYILTELSDAVVEQVSSPEEAAGTLEREKYDVVFCGLEMSSMDGLALYRRMLASPVNKETPFIIMTSSYNEAQVERLSRKGIRHVLPIPFTALQLRNMIYQVSDPRSRRVFTRYSIPHTKAKIHFGLQAVEAQVINISLNGALCEFACPDPPVDLMSGCRISVCFPAEYGGCSAQEITASLLRLTAETWRRNYAPKKVRVAFKFVDLSPDTRKVFEDAFERAKSELVFAEGAATEQSW